MRWYYNLKLSAKLIIGFVIVAIISIAMGIVAIVHIDKIIQLDGEMYQRHTLPLEDVSVILNNYQQERVILRDILFDNNDEKAQARYEEFSELDQYSNQKLDDFEKNIAAEDVRSSFRKLKTAYQEFINLRGRLVDMVKAGNKDQAISILYADGSVMIGKNLQNAGEELLLLNINKAKTASQTNAGVAETAKNIMIIIMTVGGIVAILLSFLIAGIIAKPVRKMVAAADKLAKGDVNADLHVDTKDELGELAEAFRMMIRNIREQAFTAEKIADGDLTVNVKVHSENDLLGKKLTEMLKINNQVLANIVSISEQVASGSRQISDSSIELAQGAAEQASSIEELTASLEEISSQTELNAQNANRANELAEVAKENARGGNLQMKELQNAIKEISQSSNNIFKIIKVIDEIAFQTNILALNAAVEAARAGQHGKGFAVVAEEVRNLAARSANAAKETADLISGSINKVEMGTRIVDDTAQTLDKIVQNVTKAAEIVENITMASNEQAVAILQINQGIVQVSQVIQSNTANSEESAAASQELSSQAELLKDTVKRFKLKT